MKTKLNTFLRTIKNMKYILPFLTIFGCTKEPQQKFPERPIDHSLHSSDILAKSLDKYITGGQSMNDVVIFLKSSYNINYEEQCQIISKYLLVSKPLDKRTNTLDINMSDLSSILESAGISKSSASFNYLTKISNLFEVESVTSNEIVHKLAKIQVAIENDGTIDYIEKEKLNSVTTLLLNNVRGIIETLNENFPEASAENGRGFKKIWRIIRSVVLSSAIGAFAGARSGLEDGMLVGAIAEGALAIAHAAVNNDCYFAIRCRHWTQDCTTGLCK